MDTFPEAIAQVVALLGDADVEATSTPGDVQVPGALVQFAGYTPTTLDGGYDLDLRVLLVSPDLDWDQAVSILADLLAPALTAVGGFLSARVDPVSVALPDGPPLPALALPLTLHVS